MPDDNQFRPEDKAKLDRLAASVKALRDVGIADGAKLQRLRPLQKQDDLWLQRFADLESRGEPGSREPWLSGWVSAQRTRYKKGILKEDRIAALEQLSWWTWEAKGRQTKKAP